MIDLFGPYAVRGEVQKRTSGKAYGVIFTDLVSRAVHIEAVCGYDTPSFLLALSRFVSVRGWPQFIYSDPGSQLIGAEKELKKAWQNMSQDELHKNGAQNGMDRQIVLGIKELWNHCLSCEKSYHVRSWKTASFCSRIPNGMHRGREPS